MQIGVDIEDSNRFEYRSQSLLDKIFTKPEQEYCLKQAKPSQHFAGKFCANEATIKALTAYGIKGVYLTDIEIYHDDNNCPCIRVLKDISSKTNAITETYFVESLMFKYLAGSTTSEPI